MLRRALLVAVVATSLVVTGSAATAADYAQLGPYVGAAWMWGTPRDGGDDLRDALQVITIPSMTAPLVVPPFNPGFDTEPLASSSEVDLTESFGLDIILGYRLSEWVAIETRLEWMEGFDVEIGRVSDPEGRFPVTPGVVDILAGEPDFEVSTLTWTVDMKVFALTGRIQPYAIIGVGVLWADPDGDYDRDAPIPNPVLCQSRDECLARLADPTTPDPDQPDPNLPIDPRVPPGLVVRILAANETDPNANSSEIGNQERNISTARGALLDFNLAFGDARDAFKADDNGGAYRTGIGVDFYLTENWTTFAEGGYLGTFGDTDSLDYWYFKNGIRYRF